MATITHQGIQFLNPLWASQYDLKMLNYVPLAYFSMSETAGSDVIELVNGWDGTYLSATVGGGTGPDGRPCPLFDGINDVAQIHTAQFAAAWDANESTMLIWIKPDSWVDGVKRTIVRMFADGDNNADFSKSDVNNSVRGKHEGNNVPVYPQIDDITSTQWLCAMFCISLSADEASIYLYENGVLLGSDTKTGLDTWTGPITSTYTAIGAASAAGNLYPWSGLVARAAFFLRSLNQAERQDLATV